VLCATSHADGGQPGYGGEGGQPGYGGKDGGQGGYGGDGSQGGYGEQIQEQLLKQSGVDLTKSLCPSGTISVTKRGHQMVTNTKRATSLREKTPQFANELSDCILYTDQICMTTCGMKVDKCASLFKECYEKACDDHEDEEGCNKEGASQAQAVKLLNGLGWKVQQESACECVPSSEAADRRKQELITFYETHAPEQSGKVEGIFKKFKTNWPQLMLTLHQKYKDAVELKEPDPEEDKKDGDKTDDDKTEDVKSGEATDSEDTANHIEL